MSSGTPETGCTGLRTCSQCSQDVLTASTGPPRHALPCGHGFCGACVAKCVARTEGKSGQACCASPACARPVVRPASWPIASCSTEAVPGLGASSAAAASVVPAAAAAGVASGDLDHSTQAAVLIAKLGSPAVSTEAALEDLEQWAAAETDRLSSWRARRIAELEREASELTALVAAAGESARRGLGGHVAQRAGLRASLEEAGAALAVAPPEQCAALEQERERLLRLLRTGVIRSFPEWQVARWAALPSLDASLGGAESKMRVDGVATQTAKEETDDVYDDDDDGESVHSVGAPPPVDSIPRTPFARARARLEHSRDRSLAHKPLSLLVRSAACSPSCFRMSRSSYYVSFVSLPPTPRPGNAPHQRTHIPAEPADRPARVALRGGQHSLVRPHQHRPRRHPAGARRLGPRRRRPRARAQGPAGRRLCGLWCGAAREPPCRRVGSAPHIGDERVRSRVRFGLGRRRRKAPLHGRLYSGHQIRGRASDGRVRLGGVPPSTSAHRVDGGGGRNGAARDAVSGYLRPV